MQATDKQINFIKDLIEQNLEVNKIDESRSDIVNEETRRNSIYHVCSVVSDHLDSDSRIAISKEDDANIALYNLRACALKKSFDAAVESESISKETASAVIETLKSSKTLTSLFSAQLSILSNSKKNVSAEAIRQHEPTRAKIKELYPTELADEILA